MTSRQLIIIFILFFLSSLTTDGQHYPDSLRALLIPGPRKEQAKAIAATAMADYFMNTHPDSAEYYASLGLDLSQRSGYLPGLFDNSCMLGKLMLHQDSLSKAVAIFENARDQIANLDDKSDALCILLLLGYVYDVRKEYLQSHKAYYEGLRIAEETGDSTFLWSYYNNLGLHYMEIKDFPKSLEMLRKGLRIYDKLREDQKKYSLASTYNNMAITLLDMNKPDSALYYLDKALKEPDLTGNYYGLHNLFGNLGRAFLMKDQPDKALDYFIQSGAALDSLKDNFNGAIAPLYASHYRYLGNVYFAAGEMEKSQKYFQLALDLSNASSDVIVQEEVLEKLSAIYEASGDYKNSLFYHKEYLEAMETMEARRTDEKIEQVSLEYQFEQDLQAREYDMEVEALRHRRKELVYLFVIFTALGILITLFLLYRLQRNKARRKHLEEKTVRLEKDKMAEELDYKNKELTTNVLYLLKKNEFISSISLKLNEILGKLKEEDARVLKSIINELDKTAEDSTWAEFELRFKEVHIDFYNRLSRQFPGLTAQELRLCAFLKLKC